MTRMSVLKRIFLKIEEFRNRFFKRITRAYPISRLMKKTFTSRNKIVTIVLFGNNVVLLGGAVTIRKIKKSISMTVHDTAMARIILILYLLITENPLPIYLANFMRSVYILIDRQLRIGHRLPVYGRLMLVHITIEYNGFIIILPLYIKIIYQFFFTLRSSTGCRLQCGDAGCDSSSLPNP